MAKTPYTRAYEHEYEKFVDKGSFYHEHHTKSRQELSYLGLGIAGEAGECADAIKKMVRKQNFAVAYDELIVPTIYEASDVLWYITRLCSVAGVTLEDLRIMNTVKLYERLLANDQGKYAIWPYASITYAAAKEYVQILEDHIEGAFQ